VRTTAATAAARGSAGVDAAGVVDEVADGTDVAVELVELAVVGFAVVEFAVVEEVDVPVAVGPPVQPAATSTTAAAATGTAHRRRVRIIALRLGTNRMCRHEEYASGAVRPAAATSPVKPAGCPRVGAARGRLRCGIVRPVFEHLDEQMRRKWWPPDCPGLPPVVPAIRNPK
jgi:hypothetical protein